ncbi:hypothetical protein N7509_009995 [Penicillium cosmopolitanum]|uniref:Xylanolytic transcriptional activator regulatory domain-containing protein n=1 Tax=Penicillium cosmopolitanum TaxID=1131564 RepID=A0A9X0B449_9EURO|nr:uncharacterized protein N7509_009995 [Penicillium cosmopolitanum]KAJ5387454.1 hypothetical protein N7509_009995 [Penicillium cosmopolitanum]
MTLQSIGENLENVNTVAGNSDDTNTSNDIFVFVYTNEKPYTCSCGSSFGRRDLLKRHQKPGQCELATPSTLDAQPSPLTGSTGDNLQWQDESLPVDQIRRGFLWEIPDLHHNTSAGPEQGTQVTGAHYEDQSLFNQQDLLALEDIESFSQNFGLNTDWYLPTEPSITQIFTGEPSITSLPTPSSPYPVQQENSHSNQSLSKLPTERQAVAEFGVLTLPILTVTPQHRTRLLLALSKDSHATPDDSLLPSHHSLTRFMNGFFDGFYPHVPIIHIPTFSIDDCDPGIFLAMSALGAQYRHEHRKAVSLFHASRKILQQSSREKGRTELYSNISVGSDSQNTTLEGCCALLLIAFATWQGEESIINEAFNLQSHLARCVRDSQLEEQTEQPESTLDWRSWVRREFERRLKLFSFTLLNLHSIAFGTPPVILSDEINLRLPCTCLEWIAPNQQKWSAVRRSVPQQQMMFQQALSQLMKSREQPPQISQVIPSPLANYVLLHALIQKILVSYQAFRLYDDEQSIFINKQKETLRTMLHAWTSQWQRAPESSLDPRNPNGPVTFTSTALLGLAYVRLGLDLGAHKILRSRNPSDIANRLLEMPRLPAGPHLLPAILHATHALSIPVRLGINFVARSHAFVWSIQHSLCGLEFAIFLSKWLFCLSNCQKSRPLDEHESRLVGWISDIVEEGRTSGDDDLWPQAGDPSSCDYLGFAVVKLWARLIRGNEQWAILKVIGDGLDIYANTCEQRLVNSNLDVNTT